jgi:hypothetical protein
MNVTAFADQLEREKARQRTHDAMRRARAGHVRGRLFGYDNVELLGPDGQRSAATADRSGSGEPSRCCAEGEDRRPRAPLDVKEVPTIRQEPRLSVARCATCRCRRV